jgi:hypothetical protein
VNPAEVQSAIRGLKVGKTLGPDGIPNRALKHLPLSVVSPLVVLFHAILCTQYFPAAFKLDPLFSILKPRKYPALPSSCRPISLYDTNSKLFEKILLSRILHEVSGSGLHLDQQFGLRPKHSTALQLTLLVERFSRNLVEKRLTGGVFLDVAKAFDIVWVEGLLYKLTLTFPRTWSKSFHPTRTDGRSKGPSSYPYPLSVACELAWHMVVSSHLSSSACM